MRKNYFLQLFVSMVLLLTACSKDDKDENSGISEGQMTATINGESSNFNVSAVSYKGATDEGKPYNYLIISGTKGSGNNSSSFAVYVYAENITAKTYSVPNYTDISVYDYLQGFSQGIYIPNAATSTDYYYSFMIENSTGTVIVTEVTTNSVKGTYDMTLANSLDKSKTMTLKGEFNAKIMTVNYNQ